MPKYLDLRGTPCPVNFVRCRLALEQLSDDHILNVDLDRGEPEETFISGFSKAGHKVQIINKNRDYLTLIVNRFDS